MSRPATALALAFEHARLRNKIRVVEDAMRALDSGESTRKIMVKVLPGPERAETLTVRVIHGQDEATCP